MRKLSTFRSMISLTGLLFFSSLFFSSSAFSWGSRGHAAICEAAVFLVQNKNLKEYLQNKPQMMGHLCNIPDIYWKSLTGDPRKFGDSAHFIDVEITGLKIEALSTDFKKLETDFTGKENKFKPDAKIFSVAEELGTLWWRADQFYRLSLEDGKKLKTLEPPKNTSEEQNNELPYNKAFYNMIVHMGLIGHFVGDASQPLHNTSDYDGYAAGHGGIHAYYEDSSVAHFGPDLMVRVINKAKSLKKPSFLKGNSTLEKMKALSILSSKDLAKVFKLDPILKPSTVKIEKGMSLRTAAERKPATEGFKRFENGMVQQMAWSALLLSHLWDDIYKQAGEPAMKAYKSYRYPLTVDFVMPDYYETKPK